MTRLLLDTHLLLWWLSGDPRLPQPVVERVQAPEAEVFVSQASLGEMAIKVSLGRLQVDLPELERQVPLQGFRWLPIHNSQLLAVAAGWRAMESIAIHLFERSAGQSLRYCFGDHRSHGYIRSEYKARHFQSTNAVDCGTKMSLSPHSANFL